MMCFGLFMRKDLDFRHELSMIDHLWILFL